MAKTVLNLDLIKDAHNKIKDYIINTPFLKSTYLSKGDRNVFYKLENTQQVRAFKIRGALNRMLNLSEEEKKRGVATISSGNHGISVALGGKLLNIKNVKIIVPENTSSAKIEKIKYYGATPLIMGKNYDEAHTLGLDYINNNNLILIDSYYNDPLVYAGQGTIGLEILEKNPNIDTILAPIGGGGLISGLAVCAKEINPNIKVYGIQTSACPAMKQSLIDNFSYEKFELEETICESLEGGVGPLAFEICKEYLDDVLLVSEEEIEEATAFLALKEHIIAEPSSAVVVAAYKKYEASLFGKETALVISGGNPKSKLLLEILNKYKNDFI
ncbi:MAG: threonine ammonia-lyase [Peptoniphilaceae bacterium]